MKITILSLGKTKADYLQEGIALYLERLKHFVNVDWIEIQDPKISKKASPAEVMKQEAELFKKHIRTTDQVYLLDEKGKTFSSRSFSSFLESRMVQSRDLTICIGGAYGFSKELLDRVQGKIALSSMTFTHQMVRLIFVEQLYRALCIMKGLPYHHD